MLIAAGGFVAPDGVAHAGDPAAGEREAAPEMVCERLDGGTVAGRLLRLDDREALIETATGPQTIPTPRIRRLSRAAGPPGRTEGTTRITLVSGGTLLGQDFEVSGATARLVSGDATIELPAGAIASAEFAVADAATPSSWLEEVPRSAETDHVVVGSNESHEFVECGVASVSGTAVNVLLDGESIAVKRSKVLGIKWLRPSATPAGAVRLESTAGSILAASPRLEGERIVATVLTGAATTGRADATEVRFPVRLVFGIDFSSARAVSLLATAWRQAEVEPLLGALGSIEELSRAFAPRRVSCPLSDGRRGEGLRLTPRTALSWAIPEGTERFRATIRPAAGLLGPDALRSAAGAPAASRTGMRAESRFTVTIDGREVLATGVAEERDIDIPVDDGRTLTILCDYPSVADGGIGPFGGGVVLIDPRLEQ